MFELKAKEKLILLLPGGCSNGIPQFRRVAVRGTFLVRTDALPDHPDRVQEHSEILLPGPVLPVPGSRIIRNGRELEIGSIRFCRDLDGNIVGCRCIVK